MAELNIVSLREVTMERIIEDILSRDINEGSAYKVLILDDFTLRMVNLCLRMSDLAKKNISLVEDIRKRRQPQPHLDGIYFLYPSDESVRHLVDDMVGKRPKYRKAHVFFTSKPSENLLHSITRNSALKGNVATLKQANMEYLVVDNQAFTTNHPYAMEDLFKPSNAEFGSVYHNCITEVADRLTTVFTSLKENPLIRYKAATGGTTNPSARASAPGQLASAVSENLQYLVETLPEFPRESTCDLLIVDRTIDPLTPLMHHWSYGSMALELLQLEGNKYTYQVQRSPEDRPSGVTCILDDNDPLWVDLRDRDMPEVNTKVADMVDTLNAQKISGMDDISTKEMGRLARNLHKTVDLKEKLDHHVQITCFLNERVEKEKIPDLGHFEQSLVFGDRGVHSNQLEKLFTRLPGTSSENKMRLLMVYAATHPQKFDRDRWQEVSLLGDADMATIQQLQLLGVDMSHVPWQQRKGRASKKTLSKLERYSMRTFHHKESGEERHLFRFYPYIQDLAEDLANGALPRDAFPAGAMPVDPRASANDSATPGSSGSEGKRRGGWARKGQSKDQMSLSASSSSFRRTSRVLDSSSPPPRRLFVFILGGMTYEEIRSAHRLTKQLGREVVIGSTSLDTASDFIQKLRDLRI